MNILKKPTLLLLTVFVASSFALPADKAEALSCVPTFPAIGQVEKINKDNNWVTVTTKNTQAFTSNDNNLDYLSDVLEKYVTNDGKLSASFENKSATANMDANFGVKEGLYDIVSLSLADYNALPRPLSLGDTIIKGGSIHVCDHGFIGVAQDDTIDFFYANTGYVSFVIDGQKITTQSDKELSCKDSVCDVTVKVTSDTTTSVLSAGDTETITNADTMFTLLGAKSVKKTTNPLEYYDWGISETLRFVLEIQSEEEPTPDYPEESRTELMKQVVALLQQLIALLRS